MKTVTETITNIVYQSEFLPNVRSINPAFARIIAWADWTTIRSYGGL